MLTENHSALILGNITTKRGKIKFSDGYCFVTGVKMLIALIIGYLLSIVLSEIWREYI